MCVQEEITQGAVSLSVETGKMTADLLQKAVKKVLEEMQKKPSQRSLHQGKQTLHQLKQHGASLTNIEITEQNIKAFSAVAKKYDIDYALKKDPTTDPPHYYVFFILIVFRLYKISGAIQCFYIISGKVLHLH